MRVCIEAVGFAAPGLESWQHARAVLRGEAPYEARELSVYQPNLLPPNERRRAAPAVRLAFRVAEDAMSRSAFKPAELAAVFATSEADTSILHRLCTALAESQRAVSPTDFHNSVHNAAAGYWSIAAGAKRSSTSLSAFDASFAAGLIEAAAQVAAGEGPLLLVAYDVVPPSPLSQVRPITQAVGTALILRDMAPSPLRGMPPLASLPPPPAAARRPPPSRGRQRITPPLAPSPLRGEGWGGGETRGEGAQIDPGQGLHATLEISPTSADESVLGEAALETLRLTNPAARALPLLQALAREQAGSVVLAGVGAQRWKLNVSFA